MMKKVPKKLLPVGLIALLCAVILSACGKNNTQNNKLPTQSDPTPESITPDTPKSTVEPPNSSVGLEYQVSLDNTRCYITGTGTCTDSHVVIPDKIDGYVVTSVTSLKGNPYGITAVTIGDTVTSIGREAFSDCPYLETIHLHDSITNIDRMAFENTQYYKNSANWENGVLYLGNYLLAATKWTEGSCVIRDGTTFIADYAFKGCDRITSITIPDSVTTIGGSAFSGCHGFTAVTIPNSVKTIDYEAFSTCNNLVSVTIPNSVTTIGSEAFYACKNLSEIAIGNGIESLGSRVFVGTAYYNNSNNWERTSNFTHDKALYLENYLIGVHYNSHGHAVKEGTLCIADDVFQQLHNLEEVYLPDSLRIIPQGLFSNCANLVRVSIGNTIKFFPPRIFSHDRPYTKTIEITFRGAKAEWEAIEKHMYWYESTDKFIIHCTDGDIVVETESE